MMQYCSVNFREYVKMYALYPNQLIYTLYIDYFVTKSFNLNLRSLIAQQYMFEKRFLFSYWRPGKLKNTKVLFEDLSEIILVHLYWRLNFRLADALPLDQLDLDSEFEVSYSPFNKNIPKSSLQMHCFSVMFYEIGVNTKI